MAWIWFGLTVLAVWTVVSLVFALAWCLLVPRVTQHD